MNPKNNIESLQSRPWLYWPVLLAMAVMIPRLMEPYFGLLDDGAYLHSAREIVTHFSMCFRFLGGSGLFSPVAGLYYTFIYLLAGDAPRAFFLANTIILAFITATIISFVRFRGGTGLQASASGVFFVLSGPVLENFYTNGKREVPQMFLLMSAILLLIASAAAEKRWLRILGALGTFVFLLLSCLTKEPTLVMAGIAIFWLLTQYLPLSADGDRFKPPAAFVLVFTSVAAAIAFFAIRRGFVTVSFATGTYTEPYNFDAHRLLASGFAWTGYLLRDFPYLFPLSIILVLAGIRKKQRQGRLLQGL